MSKVSKIFLFFFPKVNLKYLNWNSVKDIKIKNIVCKAAASNSTKHVYVTKKNNRTKKYYLHFRNPKFRLSEIL